MIGAGVSVGAVAARQRAASGGAGTHTVTITVDPSGFAGGSTPAGPVITVNDGASLDIDFYGDHGDTMVIAQGGFNVDGVAVPAAQGQTDYVLHLTNIVANHTVYVFWDSF